LDGDSTVQAIAAVVLTRLETGRKDDARMGFLAGAPSARRWICPCEKQKTVNVLADDVAGVIDFRLDRVHPWPITSSGRLKTSVRAGPAPGNNKGKDDLPPREGRIVISQIHHFLGQLRRTALLQDRSGLTDGLLLELFIVYQASVSPAGHGE